MKNEEVEELFKLKEIISKLDLQIRERISRYKQIASSSPCVRMGSLELEEEAVLLNN